MITLVNEVRGKRTYKVIETEQFVQTVREGAYKYFDVNTSVRFSGEYKKVKDEVVLKKFNPLVCLAVHNLPGKEEMERIFDDACHIPYSYIVWHDEETRSIMIVCKTDWAQGMEPTDKDMMQRYLENGYKQLHYLYSSQLRLSIDTERPTLDMECKCVSDENVYFNADSIPMFVDDRDIEIAEYKADDSKLMSKNTIPGLDSYETKLCLYYECMEKAQIEARKIVSCEEELDSTILHILAERCFDAGIPMEFAVSLTLIKNKYYQKETLVKKSFECAYADNILGNISLGVMDKNALLVMRTEAYLNAWYELRKNTLSGVVQWRERTAYNFDFKDLTEEDLNSMTIRALKAGLGSWDKDIRRIIHSNDIKKYDPLNDYISNLPKWDGKDRVQELIARIPSDCPNLFHYMHVWLLSMVAHWLGKDPLHGNALVPLLIGHQGCRKTTFAAMLLPPCLRRYYNDKVDFRSEADVMTALSDFALINIDEFDSLKNSQQPTLKYIISKNEVKVRPTYGKSIVHRRRYASFIATTNLEFPLTDKTGSRRFLCIKVRNGESIDTDTPIEYDQLYAQLYHEIMQGMKYWFDDAENEELQRHNSEFMHLSSFSEIVDSLFEPSTDKTSFKSLDEIVGIILDRYTYINRTNNTNREIGHLLKQKGYTYKKTSSCAMYQVGIKDIL